MTENEAINHLELCKKSRMFIPNNDVLEVAIQALEKVQQFEAIGTVDEFKALKEKNEPKKPIYKFEYEDGTQFYDCPVCGRYVMHSGVQSKEKYCSNCGIKLDWSE